MYPYNLKRKNTSTSIAAKERMNQNNTDLSADRRLQELLQLAQQDAAALEQKYTALLKEELLKDAESILNTLVTDEKKHQRILREILFTIFSDTINELLPDPENTEPEAETKSVEALLEELLFTEMDDITFFRNLLSAMTVSTGSHADNDLWDMIFEIITDKQNHTAALNHLYAKYFAKTTGNNN